MLILQNSVNLRIKNIHFVNTINFLDHIMRLLKAFLPSKVINKVSTVNLSTLEWPKNLQIVIHKTADTLSDYIPKEYLPSNYGGSEKSMEELYGSVEINFSGQFSVKRICRWVVRTNRGV